jgi:hypothetical protein
MTWLPKFLPTTQFHDSPNERNGYGVENLTLFFIKHLLDVVSDFSLLLELIESIDDDLNLSRAEFTKTAYLFGRIEFFFLHVGNQNVQLHHYF